ncbi:AraC family transcriptional regulator [Ideonella sp.]|uniref:AraC family transcriptional regulator n=1 Tax=Ideonella sp. TaxID=1929293 RepID=UPI0035B3B121
MPPPRQLPRQRQPELERDFTRSPALGYEAPEDVGLIRCLAHGFPTPLARWHHHDEYELHLIVASAGKAFVGDWIGPFEPGHLVLAGPRLPHNWVSTDVPEGGIAVRDLVIQFPHGPIAHAAEQLPELAEVLPMLERARHGIEFFGLGDLAERQWYAIKGSRGLKRLAAFTTLLAEMAQCTDYRMLSSVQMQSADDDQQLDQINAVVQRIMADVAQPLAASEIAASLGMSESRFSRFFRRATGNTFTDFVNRVRVQRACQLLMDSDRLVTHICYEVGFNNVANFNRRFLEIKGMTPTEFRRQSDKRFGGAPKSAA